MSAERTLFELVDRAAPERIAGAAGWSLEVGDWRLRFLGRGFDRRPAEGLGELLPDGVAAAWLTQRHTGDTVAARPGDCGVADALEIGTDDLAGVVVTADCLPIAVVRGARAVLVHAGWRGLAAELPRRAAERLGGSGEAVAWIGPAIGPCCYEVGEEVAAEVARASGEIAVVRRDAERPRLDLRLAAALQLCAAGVARIRLLDHCTRCRGDVLWSHRGTGGRAGRNLAILWRPVGAG